MAIDRNPAAAMLCAVLLLHAAFQLASAGQDPVAQLPNNDKCGMNIIHPAADGANANGKLYAGPKTYPGGTFVIVRPVDGGCAAAGGECKTDIRLDGFFNPDTTYEAFCYKDGKVIGDPHFTGFDGFSFDMQGEDGKAYNLISHEEVQANVILAKVHGNWDHALSFMAALAVKHRSGDVVTVEKEDRDQVFVKLNGLPVELHSSLATALGVTVSFTVEEFAAGSPKAKEHTQSDDTPVTMMQVVIGTPIFLFTVDIPPNAGRRLDVSVGLRKSIAELEGSVEGLLGHTVRAKHPAGAKKMKEAYPDTEVVTYPHGKISHSVALEAEMAAKYSVPSGLLGDDFPLNKFNADQEAVRAAVTGEQEQEALEGATRDAQDVRRRALLTYGEGTVDVAVFATASAVFV